MYKVIKGQGSYTQKCAFLLEVQMAQFPLYWINWYLELFFQGIFWYHFFSFPRKKILPHHWIDLSMGISYLKACALYHVFWLPRDAVTTFNLKNRSIARFHKLLKIIQKFRNRAWLRERMVLRLHNQTPKELNPCPCTWSSWLGPVL